MKLLFDENLSFRLERLPADLFPGSAHVTEPGLQGAADEATWKAAAEGKYLLTSKNTDFYQRSLLYGAPPKVIWLRVGNSSTNDVAYLLRSRYMVVRRFAEDEEATFLALSTG